VLQRITPEFPALTRIEARQDHDNRREHQNGPPMRQKVALLVLNRSTDAAPRTDKGAKRILKSSKRTFDGSKTDCRWFKTNLAWFETNFA
jgi:hypothetical protein